MYEKPSPLLVSSVISAKNDFNTPKLPDNAPDNTRPKMACQYDLDSPNINNPNAAPTTPNIMIYLRPYLSDKLPHMIDVENCAAQNEAARNPA